MSAFNDYFNVNDYLNQQSAQSKTILKFRYVEGPK